MTPRIHIALSYTQHECANFTKTFLAPGIIINMHILSIYFLKHCTRCYRIPKGDNLCCREVCNLVQRSPASGPWTGTSCQISSIRLEIKYTINVMRLTHPQTICPVCRKTVPGTKKVGDLWPSWGNRSQACNSGWLHRIWWVRDCFSTSSIFCTFWRHSTNQAAITKWSLFS